jgi:hypothetical protein
MYQCWSYGDGSGNYLHCCLELMQTVSTASYSQRGSRLSRSHEKLAILSEKICELDKRHKGFCSLMLWKENSIWHIISALYIGQLLTQEWKISDEACESSKVWVDAEERALDSSKSTLRWGKRRIATDRSIWIVGHPIASFLFEMIFCSLW